MPLKLSFHEIVYLVALYGDLELHQRARLMRFGKVPALAGQAVWEDGKSLVARIAGIPTRHPKFRPRGRAFQAQKAASRA